VKEVRTCEYENRATEKDGRNHSIRLRYFRHREQVSDKRQISADEANDHDAEQEPTKVVFFAPGKYVYPAKLIQCQDEEN
jgi:hypothetical protein